MLHGWDEVLGLECNVWFSPNITFLISAEKFDFELICSQNILPIAFWITQVVFGKLETGGNVLLRE